MSSTRTNANANPNSRPRAETRSIVVDFDVPQSTTQVWRALTQAELVERWLMPNDLQPVVGHQFQFHTQPVAGWDGTVDCEVLAVEPEHLLAYSWRGGSREIQGYGHRLDTTVTWTLSPTPNGGTHVHLEHSGFTDADTFAYENMGNGWRSNVAQALVRVLAQLL
jgi:uncharacterized protein YndB with AHSA1/START domain